MTKHPMLFETTYSSDYTHPTNNRELCLQNQAEPSLPPSCFSPPPSCSTPTSPPAVPPTPRTAPITDCGTNRFLANLCHTHPVVHQDLQDNNAWMCQSSQSPLKSTYQLDYDHLAEYQLGPHPEDTKYYIRECNGTGCSGQNCCAGGRLCSCQLCHTGPYPDRSLPKPSKIPKGYIGFSHWPERPYQDKGKMTEYRDRISRIGAVIEREQIHDHCGCRGPAHCEHNFILRK